MKVSFRGGAVKLFNCHVLGVCVTDVQMVL